MLLLQFSTSHYCRKARLALGFKQQRYRVQNLTPGLHRLRLQPLCGLSTVPVLLTERSPERATTQEPEVIADSTRILHYLERVCPDPSWTPVTAEDRERAWLLEDWLDESIGKATRFVYYDYRAGAGRAIDPSWQAMATIALVRQLYGIAPGPVALARERLRGALTGTLAHWQARPYLCGDRLSVADLSAAGLLSPLALVPEYRDRYPWLFERIAEIHELCGEPLPPGLTAAQPEHELGGNEHETDRPTLAQGRDGG